MKSPILHCLILLTIGIVIFTRYAQRTYSYWITLATFNKKHNKNFFPDFMKEDLYAYYNKSAAFKRILAALVLLLPIILGTSFIFICSVDYLSFTDEFFNNWNMLLIVSKMTIKNDPNFYIEFGIISLGLTFIIVIVCLVTTKHKVNAVLSSQKSPEDA